MKLIKYLILILIVVISCKKAEVSPEELTKSTFDSPFPKNNKQLDRIFGETLLVKYYNDTLVLNIKSNKYTNLITNKIGDTVFYGKVCKYRDYYYFNHKKNDTSYCISAFKIKGNLIYGLDFGTQFFAVDENILKGIYKKELVSINSDTTVIRLKTNKVELKKLFTIIMNNTVPDTLLNPKFTLNNISKNELVTEKDEDDPDNVEYSVKAYPIPAVDFINVETNKKSSFQLINSSNKLILEGQLNDVKNKIDISNQQSGLYFLIVKNIDNSQTKTLKILIK
ncbi:T9SS type A sorting domain-containing protein [Flavobacterium sp. UMI-01]|uniref:T9SS type A sorting domain-containing protein n=1 Tax=Flavobacterium sp. UMI-01 TaxID=1441053 RepID=UPI001C7D44DA|nr:T9SS type A sorting domain-containing protein [Flavobacterium sp. UMI-01]GIZ08736.1 hypothetical protein FUMI01_14630 [Flavobacterium sp. UMI-01]